MLSLLGSFIFYDELEFLDVCLFGNVHVEGRTEKGKKSFKRGLFLSLHNI